ncbi:ACYL-COA N-ACYLTRANSFERASES (NAT) SUPERFAMILY PROTEIN [Salix purpurea]|uniref:ACYL-COA N-ACYLTRANSFERASES (NAT) SUPERFAMILY PROTEIN n=1 Tax=Salix purpurea TaxID=77065 RepID=A0A9Q0TWT8_SALPP|nr:ACYL-COA N-ACYLTRANSFERASES (NAT) SUPERFAMILY PROTEIN [Salix purpurea]
MDPSRISLRPFMLSDVDDFLKWASDDRVTRYLRWSSINSREEALTYLEKVAIHHPWRRSICLDDHSIGYISISPESGDDRCRARLGYALAAEFWGQGIATIALKMAVSSVFKELSGLVRVHAVVEVENKGSQRVLEKAGFLKEGLLRKYGICAGKLFHRHPGRQQRSVLGTCEDGETKHSWESKIDPVKDLDPKFVLFRTLIPGI